MRAAERLEKHFTPEPNTGCWLWHGRIQRDGYGKAWLNGKSVAAHRAVSSILVGRIGALKVLHRCDVRNCVNPDHLFLGTNKDNTADMFSKGRARPPYGERHWNAKLRTVDVAEIRRAYASGEKQRDIARRFGVSSSRISYVVNRKNWARS